jgi:hypothetical protein
VADNFIGWNGFAYAEMGGGIYVEGTQGPLIVNNLIIGNMAFDGAGVCNSFSGGRLLNNTILFNKGDSIGWGGGVYVAGSAPVHLVNNIIRGNYPSQVLGAGVMATYCNIEGGWPGAGNIDADPLFVDPAQHDFHITYTSPCKDTGLSTTSGLPDEDFEGDPRIAHGTVDMGADEFYTHLYVTGDATPGGNVEVKFVGIPGTVPVGFWLGAGVLDPPIPSIWGDWYLQFPIFGPVGLWAIPSPDGVLIYPGTIPRLPPAPYSIPMQALIGQELTNPCLLDVR